MILPLTKDEAVLLAYACSEMFRKHSELAVNGRKERSEFAESNEKSAIKFRALAEKIQALHK